MPLTVVILTKNEGKHIARALTSVAGIADACLVVDSGSDDDTIAIAKSHGAQVLTHPWVNYAMQFNWALDQLPDGTDWVMRLDADEIVSAQLAEKIRGSLANLPDAVEGAFVPRRMAFLGRVIRHGGLFPVKVLRLFRHGKGRCENRWMDEHILVSGQTVSFTGELLDDNRNSLTWWIEKHNHYASREVIDLLNLEHSFMVHETVADLRGGQQVGVKRWAKENIYARLPGGLRALLYFLYRYVLRLGFLDGREGTAFHVLQGFWYRYLVDAKLRETRTFMRAHDVDAVTAIEAVLGFRIKTDSQSALGKGENG